MYGAPDDNNTSVIHDVDTFKAFARDGVCLNFSEISAKIISTRNEQP